MHEDPHSIKQPGLVYTFYSYKGGVGRSMALANVGAVIAIEGQRVLLVDWDLEAPGLEAYFHSAAAKLKGDPTQTPGVIDLLEARAEGKTLSWCDCVLSANVLGHSLDIISAGRRSDDYRRRVQQLDWETLYREHRIGNYVNALREEWRAEYDCILVDSRTGITDIGDLCTVLLPDVLILFFVTNRQNVEGVKAAMDRAVRARAKLPVNRNKLLAVPVPARDDRKQEYDKSLEWQQIFAAEFSGLYQEWLPQNVKPFDALNHVFIPYVSKWSFGERIPVIENERERSDPTSIGAAFVRLATLLSHRLDWSAIDEMASSADLASARAEVSAAREAVRDAQAATEEAKKALSRTTVRTGLIVALVSVIVATLSFLVYYSYFAPKSPLEFVEDLKNQDIAIRRGAAEALGQFGKVGAKFAPDVAALLKDPDPTVRGVAAEALGKFREAGAKLPPDVAALLKDPDPLVRWRAADALGLFGEAGAKFAPDVAALLKDPNFLVRERAAEALGKFGEAGAKFAPDVAALLKDPNFLVRERAAEALGKFGEAGAKFASDVAALLKDPHPFVNYYADRALRSMGNSAPKYLPKQ